MTSDGANVQTVPITVETPLCAVTTPPAKVDHEIPFTRTFYESMEVESADAIIQRITRHEKNLAAQLKKLFGEVK